MHPIEFVSSAIAENRTEQIIEIIHRFCDKLRESKTREHACVYNFANMFLVSVAGQLRLLGQDQTLDDDKFLSVWSELGFFGIERDQIPNNCQD